MLPLEGVKVVELAIWLAGPACGVIMADCGADVIKVEHLETGGDPARGWTPTDATVKQDPNYVFETMNRGKARHCAGPVPREGAGRPVHAVQTSRRVRHQPTALDAG